MSALLRRDLSPCYAPHSLPHFQPSLALSALLAPAHSLHSLLPPSSSKVNPPPMHSVGLLGAMLITVSAVGLYVLIVRLRFLSLRSILPVPRKRH